MASTLFVAASSASSWGNGARRSQTACRMLSAELPFSHSGVRHASVSVLGATRREHEPLLGVRRVGAREADSTSGQRRLEQLLDEFDDMQLLATQLGVERMEIAPLMVRAACGQLVSLREQSIPAPNDDTLFKALVELKQRDADRAPMMHELRNAHTFPVDLNELTTKEWEVVFAAEHKSGKLSYAGAPGAMPRARVDFQLRADHRSNGAQVIRGTMREVSEIMPGVSAFRRTAVSCIEFAQDRRSFHLYAPHNASVSLSFLRDRLSPDASARRSYTPRSASRSNCHGRWLYCSAGAAVYWDARRAKIIALSSVSPR
uniref:Uncharacterized protein n=1 Tax=Erythrolobus australicus TaxID=1077150 RepID=A0A7S1XI13_9RHOD|mmetsp:Transcript_2040/g.5438  ORF Transcript_2040/g.5438 Transcript_2040/m.5438 type:complete len:317 (+) Transcript_2040:168-1118(+)